MTMYISYMIHLAIYISNVSWVFIQNIYHLRLLIHLEGQYTSFIVPKGKGIINHIFSLQCPLNDIVQEPEHYPHQPFQMLPLNHIHMPDTFLQPHLFGFPFHLVEVMSLALRRT